MEEYEEEKENVCVQFKQSAAAAAINASQLESGYMKLFCTVDANQWPQSYR